MTGNVASLLTLNEKTLIKSLVDRFPWDVAKPIIASLGLALGRGKDNTLIKMLTDLSEMKSKHPDKFSTFIKDASGVLFNQFLYGEKALYSLHVEKEILLKLKLSLNDEWKKSNKEAKLTEIILSQDDIKKTEKNYLDLIYLSHNENTSMMLFSSVRDHIIREKISPLSVPDFSDYDEIVAKKKERVQCFDSCLINYDTSTINIMVDINGSSSGADSLLPKATLVNKFYELAGTVFESEEKDFYCLIDPIFKQDEKPFSNVSYKVFDLSFQTPEGTSHKEKKTDESKDLRDDLFNQKGIEAVGSIGLFRIGIRIERNDVSLNINDNIELLIPGTLRRHLYGAGVSPVSYAIISKCIRRSDFEMLTDLIL